MKEFTNGLPTLVMETFLFFAQFYKPKLYKWWPTLVSTISRHRMVGWRHFVSTIVYNFVYCLVKNARMDKNVVNQWKQNLPNIIQGYDTRDI
jgi:hypothetical protein